VFRQVFFATDARKVGDVVVGGVSVDVMDVHAIGYLPMMELPHISMKPRASA
jgi:hypothetical protein